MGNRRTAASARLPYVRAVTSLFVLGRGQASFDVRLATNPFLYLTLGYSPLTDLTPVTRLTNFTNALLVPNSSTANSRKEFIARADGVIE